MIYFQFSTPLHVFRFDTLYLERRTSSLHKQTEAGSDSKEQYSLVWTLELDPCLQELLIAP